MLCGIAATGTSGPPISRRASGQARSPAIRSSQDRPSGPGPSKKVGPPTWRDPAVTAPRCAASWWKYMSSWVVHPPSSDSSAPRVAPSSTVAGSMTAPSAAHTRVRNPWRSTPSAIPRSSVIDRCVWRLTSPGRARRPRPSMTSSPARTGTEPICVMTPSSTAMETSRSTVSSASTVTTMARSRRTTRLTRRPRCRRPRTPTSCGRARRARRAPWVRPTRAPPRSRPS